MRQARDTAEALLVVFLWTAAVMSGLVVATGVVRLMEGACGF